MDYFANNPNADAISRVRGGIADVKNIMIENIEKVLERGERFELLVEKSSQLGQEAFIFKKEARRLKRQMRWKVRNTLIIYFKKKNEHFFVLEFEDDVDCARYRFSRYNFHCLRNLRSRFQLLSCAFL